MQIAWPPGIGAVIAIIVIVLALVFAVLGQLPWMLALFIIALAAARLL